jgi:hypothetical protein
MKTHLLATPSRVAQVVHRRTSIHSYPSCVHSNARHLNLQFMVKNETATTAGAKDKWRVLAPDVFSWEMRWD